MNKPYITKVHIVIEILAGAIALAAVLIAVGFALTADGPVAMHYDMQGNVNGWGSAWGAVVMPIIMLITGAGMSAVVHFVPAETWNTGIRRIRPSRKNIVYSDCALMIVLLELEFALFSLAFTIGTMLGNGSWFVAAALTMIAAMTVTVIVSLIRANRHNKQ